MGSCIASRVVLDFVAEGPDDPLADRPFWEADLDLGLVVLPEGNTPMASAKSETVAVNAATICCS